MLLQLYMASSSTSAKESEDSEIQLRKPCVGFIWTMKKSGGKDKHSE